jgi:DNA-directed RNA polymerase subunit RPC12/RpoP
MRVTRRPQSEVFLTASRGDYRHTAEGMQHREDEHPVVRCPGCQQPMEPKERTWVTDRLVDIRYVCATCSMDTKRTIKEAK